MSDLALEIAIEALRNIQNSVRSGTLDRVQTQNTTISALAKINDLIRDKMKDQYNSREWEYMVRYVGDVNPLTPEGLALLLNQEGVKHWELVSHDSRIGLLILKRPKL